LRRRFTARRYDLYGITIKAKEAAEAESLNYSRLLEMAIKETLGVAS
jgi:hypothetical protein